MGRRQAAPIFTCMKALIIVLGLLAPVFSMAQNSDTALSKSLPAIPLLLGDSATLFNIDSYKAGKPVLLMLFSPDCDHCQQTAEELVRRKSELQDVQIIFATLSPLFRMNAFTKEYRLNELPNIIIGRDFQSKLISFFGVKYIPYLAFYNSKGQLVRGVQGSLPAEKIFTLLRSIN